MKIRNLFCLIFCTLAFTSFAAAQNLTFKTAQEVKDTPAFLMLAAHKAKISNELANLQIRFTQIHPDVVAKRDELKMTELETAKLFAVPQSKLNEPYGQLVIRKISAETQLLNLLNGFTLSHPKVTEAVTQLKAIEDELSAILSNNQLKHTAIKNQP